MSRRTALATLASGGLSVALLVAGCGDDDDPVRPTSRRSVPDPTGTLVGRWSTDPFSLGAYSAMAVGASPADRQALAEPMSDRLVLAGEATDPQYPATVHGAWLSGRRAAAQVLDATEPATRVVVVGAGMAGIAAARSLRENGVEVVVVEGRSRVGGRVVSDDRLGPPLDLGASWIHGTDANPLTELAEAVGANTMVTDFDDVHAHDARSGPLGDADLLALEAAVGEVLSEVEARAEVRDEDTSVASLVTEVLAEWDLDDDERRLLRFGVASLLDYDLALATDELSAWWFDEDDAFGGPEVLFPGGYDQLPVALADDLDVLFDHTVERVEHGAGAAEVITSAGTVRGSHAIVTVPLGVLQAGAITFDPPLPEGVTEAIDRLGMGVLTKVFLRFDEVFWHDAHLLGFVAPDDTSWASWLNLAAFTGEPILLGFNAGAGAAALEALGDEAVVASAMTALRTMYS